VPFFCISCKTNIDPKFKACPYCGEPITDFLRRYLDEPIDGKYQIISRLGIGGMGEVYKVLHIHLNTVRVIKLMRASITSEEGSHERFLREARLATRIQHPNVATLFDFSALGDGSYYMVWEFIEGTNLMEQIRARGSLSPRYSARLAYQALMGLDAVHRVGVVHRDISPENLMITRDEDGEERVKIIDLGIAKQWGDSADDKTKTGMFVGKWKYCSPEHLGMLKEGERIDGRADIYSFGIVLYEMLTGQPPFLADTPHRYLLLHATESPRPLNVANPNLETPPQLEALIFKALEKDRNNRFTSAREFARALEALIPDLPDLAAPPVGPIEIDEQSTEERPLLAVTGVEAVRVPPGEHSESETISRIENIRNQETVARLDTLARSETVSSLSQQSFLPAPSDAAVVPNRRIGWAAGAVAASVLIALVIFGMLRKGSDDRPLPTGVAAASTVTATPTVRLGVNAFPWAEVKEIRNAKTGMLVTLPEKITTPAAIDLPPGQYVVILENPRLKKSESRTVTLAAGAEEALTVLLTRPADSYPSFGGNL